MALENTSQLLLRNRDALPRTPTEIWNPRPDGLFRELLSDRGPIVFSSDRYSVCHSLRSAGADVHFEAWTPPQRQPDNIILVLPREKERLDMRLHEAATRLQEGGKLFLVGENRAGIKSSPRLVARHFDNVVKRDSARHCSLFEATGPSTGDSFQAGAYERRWTFGFQQRTLEVSTLPGVFAHGRLDAGTELLLSSLPKARPSGRILDFACGAGVIGLAILATSKPAQVDVTLLDDSALALESARRSLELNGLQARVLPSDGLSEVTGRFDWIVTNPPFHQGVKNDLDVARAFFRRAGTFLTEKGRILVVFNRHLPYESWLRESFNNVECLARNRVFSVMSARNR